MENGMSFIGYVKICLGMIKREKYNPKDFTLVDVYTCYEENISPPACIKKLLNK